MPIFVIFIVLVVTGFLLWLVNVYIPMQKTVKNILNAAIVIILVIWLLQQFGIWQYLMSAHT